MAIVKYVTYSVKENNIDNIKIAVAEFIHQIHEHELDTIYTAFQIQDTNNYCHFMSFKNEEDEKKHREASYTKKFVEVLYPLCLEPPKFYDLRLVSDS